MEEHSRNSKEGKQVSKMQSASKRREFLSHVQQYTTDKIYAMIRKGIDPNFHCPNTGGIILQKNMSKLIHRYSNFTWNGRY